MKAIWKYPVIVADHQLVMMPKESMILCAQLQGGQLFIWAEVEVGAVFVNRSIYVRGTGHEFEEPPTHCYIGTVQQGPFVWHLFAGGERT